MAEREQSIISKMTTAPKRWFRQRWNETHYGFSEGQLPRQRMDALLIDHNLSYVGVSELLDLIGKSSSSRLTLMMVTKVHDSIIQLIEVTEVIEAERSAMRASRLPQMDMEELSKYIGTASKEEGLD